MIPKLKFIFFILTMFTLTACEQPNDLPMKVSSTIEMVELKPAKKSIHGNFMGVAIAKLIERKVFVAANTKKCWGFMAELPCLVVTFENGDERLFSEGIAGYKHVEGVAQNLIVEEVHLDTSNPQYLPTDVSYVQYRLKK